MSESNFSYLDDVVTIFLNNANCKLDTSVCPSEREENVGNQELSSFESKCTISHESLRFLRELFFLSRVLNMDKRYDLYVAFLMKMRQPFFTAMLNALLISSQIESVDSRNNDDSMGKVLLNRAMAAEILCTVAQICPATIRQFIFEGPTPQPPPPLQSSVTKAQSLCATDKIKDGNNRCLLYVLIRLVTVASDTAVIEHLSEVLKAVLDSERIDKVDKEKFLGVFYDYYIHWILLPFSTEFSPLVAPNDVSVLQVSSVQEYSAMLTSRRCLCEILSLCVQGHAYRMKYFVMRNNGIGKVLSILNSPYRSLCLGALKFMRALLSVKDDFYHRHIVKFDLMKPIFELLQKYSYRDNMITSTIVEMVEFIRSENLRVLVDYIIERYGTAFDSLEYVDTFDRLRLKYDQLNEVRNQEEGEHFIPSREESDGENLREPLQSKKSIGAASTGITSAAGKIRNKQLAEMESEEDYFDADDDETDEIVVDENQSAHHHGGFATKRKVPGEDVEHNFQFNRNPLALLTDSYGDDDDTESGSGSSVGTDDAAPAVENDGRNNGIGNNLSANNDTIANTSVNLENKSSCSGMNSVNGNWREELDNLVMPNPSKKIRPEIDEISDNSDASAEKFDRCSALVSSLEFASSLPFLPPLRSKFESDDDDSSPFFVTSTNPQTLSSGIAACGNATLNSTNSTKALAKIISSKPVLSFSKKMPGTISINVSTKIVSNDSADCT